MSQDALFLFLPFRRSLKGSIIISILQINFLRITQLVNISSRVQTWIKFGNSKIFAFDPHAIVFSNLYKCFPYSYSNLADQNYS